MAGEGRKIFSTNDILLASDVQDYLMDQSVMVFADAAERDSEILVPTEGMVIYLEDTNLLYKYDGSSWLDIVALSLDDLTDVSTSGVSEGQVLSYGTATSSWSPAFTSGFTASTAITSTNASWSVPTLGHPVVKVTVISGGGSGAARGEPYVAGNAGGNSVFACSAGTVTATGGLAGGSGGKDGRDGWSAGNGGQGIEGGGFGDVEDGGAGEIKVAYLDLSGVSTASVTVGAGGAAVSTSGFTSGAGGDGVVIVEYQAGA